MLRMDVEYCEMMVVVFCRLLDMLIAHSVIGLLRPIWTKFSNRKKSKAKIQVLDAIKQIPTSSETYFYYFYYFILFYFIIFLFPRMQKEA